MRAIAFLLSASVLGLVSAAAGQDSAPTNQIHYPLAEELGGLLETADQSRREGKHEQAIELYRSVLDADQPKNGYQIARLSEGLGQGEPRRFLGVTEWAIRGLRALPKDGRALFRSKYDYRASSALDEARRATDPYAALARAYELYPISSYAVQLLERMAELSLERGNFARARRVLQLLLEHHEQELPSPPRIRKKLLLCALGLGESDEVRSLGLALKRDDPDGEIHMGGAPIKLEELVTQALEVEAVRRGKQKGTQPSSKLLRSDSANRAAVPTRPAFGAARFAPKVFDNHSLLEQRAGGGILHGTLPQGGFPARNLPLVHEGLVFLCTADSLLAFDLLTGEEPRRIIRPQGRPVFQDRNAKVQFGGAIDQGILLAPLVETVLRDQSYRGIPIKVRIPIRKLAAFDLERWAWQWDHAALLAGTNMERWSFPTPPLVQEGVAYVSAFSIEGAVNCHVTAFDVRTGGHLWSTWIASGQVEQTMFGEQATEPLCVPVAVSDGLVYFATSFGCVAAVEADTGRPVWVTEYEQIEVRAPRGYYADPRNIAWENNAPVVESGVVVVAPLDSPNYYGIDAKDGRRLWNARRRAYAADADMRYVMGATDGRVVLAGGHDVRCLDVRVGKLKWRAPLRGRLVSGRGCIAGDVVCIPVDRNEVFLFDLVTGKRTGRHDLAATGNLLVIGGDLVVTGNGTLVVHQNGDSKRGRDFK